MINYVQQRKDFDSRVADDSKVIGYAINPGPVQTKTKFYDYKFDVGELNIYGQNIDSCLMVLCRVFGSAMWLRYPKYLIKFN